MTRVRSGGVEVSYRRFTIDGHDYLSLDTSSGLRRHDQSKSWFGGYCLAATDFFTGLPLALQVFRADIQEWNGYPALFADLLDALGEPPYIVSVDRGSATRAFYEFNTRRGVAVVGPRRKHPNRIETRDWRTDAFDEHGIPRCQYCGGEGEYLSPGTGLVFSEGGEPRLRYRCLVPFLPECKRSQSIACSEEWLMLLPLARTSELYQAVCQARSAGPTPRLGRPPTGTRERVYALIVARGEISSSELADELELTRGSVRYHMRRLKESGRIEPAESRPQSRRQRYRAAQSSGASC